MSTSEERLRVAYERIAERLTGWNAVVEPFESVATVYRHRAYWKPAQVKVVLLAESHLFTPAKELANTVDLSAFGYPEAPREYARFVYCLGYGEDGIVQGRVVKNAGTWQFWRLFHACLNGAPEGETFASVLKNGTPDVSARWSPCTCRRRRRPVLVRWTGRSRSPGGRSGATNSSARRTSMPSASASASVDGLGRSSTASSAAA